MILYKLTHAPLSITYDSRPMDIRHSFFLDDYAVGGNIRNNISPDDIMIDGESRLREKGDTK